MLPTQRRQAILAEIRAQSAVSAEELARQFGVSVETIRRDLRGLQDKGLLERVYGGATRPPGRSSEGSFAARSVRHIGRKRAIAALAACLVEPEDTIVIDVGTTALEVARALPAGVPRPGADQLGAGRDGAVRPRRRRAAAVRRAGPAAATAPARARTPRRSSPSSTPTGPSSAPAASTPAAGLTDYYPAEVVVRRTIIAHTAASYVLADSSKLGVIAVHRVCPLDRITAVITDDEEDPGARAELTAAASQLLRGEHRQRSLTEAG